MLVVLPAVKAWALLRSLMDILIDCAPCRLLDLDAPNGRCSLSASPQRLVCRDERHDLPTLYVESCPCMLYNETLRILGLTCTPSAVSHSLWLCIVRTAWHAVSSFAKTQGIFADAAHNCVPLRDRLANGDGNLPLDWP